jgi:hypothetical protein
MKSAHVRANPESFHHLYDSRTMEQLSSLDGDNQHGTDTTTSRSFTTVGDTEHTGPTARDQEHHHFRLASLRDPASDALPMELMPHHETLSESHHGHIGHHRHHQHRSSSSRRNSFPPARVMPSDYQASLREWAGPDMEAPPASLRGLARDSRVADL